ncbi:GNAT family N-acetyltransferase [Gluconobacter morbifer]|uniref:Putative acetyltransferase (Antibiotic resistance ) protein n=1 Tax=Gluconobacter morbifer G707 TaxID=1088869 RepID=G6XHZ4_9PROT|nr:GNAT family N-acetyltransferase [Gluconobacter morbifer]EHH68434.1 putative acetyltransferase (antibiotic resistance) protein [Gluconobacter morbifer G707]
MSVTIREAWEQDLPEILSITNDAIEKTDALWISTPFTLAQRRQWFEERRARGFPVLVAVDETDHVIGYGSYGPFRAFEGYAKTVEHSLYVAPVWQGHGTGQQLLAGLRDHAKVAGFHVMVAAITAGNAPSIALHRRFGFQENGTLPQVGQKNGRWLDLLFMTLCLETVPQTEKDFS